MSASAPSVNDSAAENQRFTLRQRLALWIVSWVGYLAIRLIGPTIRFQTTVEEGSHDIPWPKPVVYVFWHRSVFPATWVYRDNQFAVMTSSSFDGEYIARIIKKFGFRPVRGSSTRGGVRALLATHTEIESGYGVAFTIDGPRGPVYIAKPGPVLLARNTRTPIVAFYIAVEDGWVLKSWDRFVIPKPFTRAHICISKPIPVSPETDANSAQQIHAEMQAALDRVRQYAEAQLPGIKTCL